MKHFANEDGQQHELMHNWGMEHGATAKTRLERPKWYPEFNGGGGWPGIGHLPFNTKQYGGYSRVSGGGMYRLESERTRYANNGHAAAGSKHWYGWVDDEAVVQLHPLGANGCSGCLSAWKGKLNAFDRPDVVPGPYSTGHPLPASGSKTFLLKVDYGGDNSEHVLYIYYRDTISSCLC